MNTTFRNRFAISASESARFWSLALLALLGVAAVGLMNGAATAQEGAAEEVAAEEGKSTAEADDSSAPTVSETPATEDASAEDASAETSTSEDEETLPPDPKADQMMEDFDRLMVEWVEAMSAMRAAQIQFHNSTAETEQQYREAFQKHQPVARQRYDDLLQHAIKMIEYRSGGAPFLWEFIARSVEHRGEVDWYEGLAEPAKQLESVLKEGSLPDYHSIAARALVTAGEFEAAREHLKKSLRREKPLDCDIRLISTLDALQQAWQDEQERLAKDPDDLPRVELETTRGKVLIELYEDQAPNTVANFIQLVEEGFYDQLAFYQVLDQLFALTGDPIGDGSGSSGRFIPDESDHPDARATLRGSLVQAKLPKPNSETGETIPDSGSSQLMILLLPLKMDNGNFTVFGRVIEGMDAISYLTRLNPSEKSEKNKVVLPPDRVISAKVIRKREHDYRVRYVS